eukprot:GHRQ01035666.1.p1 GENE.GHRQ01035666.1~~GHRQ01035666.1.p1  ORF type:complete len:137 (+),score=34.62 GHRQ01035666.1:433-843(+)
MAKAPFTNSFFCIALLPPYVASRAAAPLALAGRASHYISGSLRGIMQEMLLCTERSTPLHFSYIDDVTAPTRVYMGTADTVMLYSHVQHWAQHAQAGNVELITVEGGTHDGVMHTHKAAALEALAADLTQQQEQEQ